MTLGDAIRDAIKTQDAARAGRISDRLRRMGLNYKQQFEVVKRAAPDTELPDWDALLYEADEATSRQHPRGQTIYSW